MAHRHLPSLVGARSPKDPAWLHCPVGTEHTNPKTKADGSNIATPRVISNHQDVRSTFSNSVLGVWFKLRPAPVCGEQRPPYSCPHVTWPRPTQPSISKALGSLLPGREGLPANGWEEPSPPPANPVPLWVAVKPKRTLLALQGALSPARHRVGLRVTGTYWRPWASRGVCAAPAPQSPPLEATLASARQPLGGMVSGCEMR